MARSSFSPMVRLRISSRPAATSNIQASPRRTIGIGNSNLRFPIVRIRVASPRGVSVTDSAADFVEAVESFAVQRGVAGAQHVAGPRPENAIEHAGRSRARAASISAAGRRIG